MAEKTFGIAIRDTFLITDFLLPFTESTRRQEVALRKSKARAVANVLLECVADPNVLLRSVVSLSIG